MIFAALMKKGWATREEAQPAGKEVSVASVAVAMLHNPQVHSLSEPAPHEDEKPKDGADLTPSIDAILATQPADNTATVATVAVAKPSPPPKLTQHEESKIRAWLAHIGETDPRTIAEVMDGCRSNLEGRQYLLMRSEDVPEAPITNHPISCADCRHFKRIDHPHLGHCAKAQPEAIVGNWDADQRDCERFVPFP